LLSSNTSSTRPYNVANFGLLAAEIVSLVWGTAANFNEFRVLAAFLRGTLDRHQNLIICLLAHCQRSLKMSCKFVANRQTNRQTRSTGTVHTSAKARLTSVAIRIQIRIRIRITVPPECNHLFTGPLPTCPENCSCKSVRQFLRKVANRQTDRQTNKRRR